jgi:hypothetical protein
MAESVESAVLVAKVREAASIPLIKNAHSIKIGHAARAVIPMVPVKVETTRATISPQN